MAIQVKICGINSVKAADAVAEAGAEFAGLVFFPKSPRHVGLDLARALAARLRGRTKIVALFADAGDSDIAEILAAIVPDLVQLHGNETPSRTGEVAARYQLPVIKALPIGEPTDLARTKAYLDAADYFLFDAKAPSSAERPGGHGLAFDWKMLAGARFRQPWLLAGGLTAENVVRAIHASGATIVDTSSGVEDAPGRKNPEKIAAFVAAAKHASNVDAA